MRGHAASIRTQYLEDDNHVSFKRSPSTACAQIKRPREEVYIAKLEQAIKEHTATIKNNKPAIEQLEYQRKFFKKICEKQKQKLENIDVNMMREQYQKQMVDLKFKRSKLHEMISNIHDEAEQKKKNFLSTAHSLEQTKRFLLKSLSQLDEQNANYDGIIAGKEQVLRIDKTRQSQSFKALQQKERVQDKYRIIYENKRKLKQQAY